eukprot:8969823-Alexandrium_andersonii.AAC.1
MGRGAVFCSCSCPPRWAAATPRPPRHPNWRPPFQSRQSGWPGGWQPPQCRAGKSRGTWQTLRGRRKAAGSRGKPDSSDCCAHNPGASPTLNSGAARPGTQERGSRALHAPSTPSTPGITLAARHSCSQCRPP